MFCPHTVGMLFFTYPGKDLQPSHLQCCLTEVWKATVDKKGVQRNVIESLCPKRCNITMHNFITNSICEKTWIGIMWNIQIRGSLVLEHLLSKSKIRCWLICEIGLYEVCGKLAIKAEHSSHVGYMSFGVTYDHRDEWLFTMLNILIDIFPAEYEISHTAYNCRHCSSMDQFIPITCVLTWALSMAILAQVIEPRTSAVKVSKQLEVPTYSTQCCYNFDLKSWTWTYGQEDGVMDAR